MITYYCELQQICTKENFQKPSLILLSIEKDTNKASYNLVIIKKNVEKFQSLKVKPKIFKWGEEGERPMG